MEELNWIDDVVEKVRQNCNGRKVIICGYNTASKDIAIALKNIAKVEFFIEDKADSIDGRVVRSFCEIDGKSSEYYLVVTMGYNDDKKRCI